MGEVLRPRKGERPRTEAGTASESPAITPERQPLATHSRNLFGQALPDGRNPPVRSRRHCRRPTRWGPNRAAAPTGSRAGVIGPSPADRGAFPPAAQGGSLLASNGPITDARPGGTTRPHRVASNGRTKGKIGAFIRTDPGGRFTASNRPYLCQDLVKRGRLLSPDRENGRDTPGVPRPRCHIRTRPAPAPYARRRPADRRGRSPRTAPAAAAAPCPGRRRKYGVPSRRVARRRPRHDRRPDPDRRP